MGRRLSVGLIVFLAVVQTGNVSGQSDRARTEALAKRASDRLTALQREADRLAADERSLLSNLRRLEVERQIKAEELKQVDAEVAAVQKDLDQTRRQMTALQESEARVRPELRARLIEIYKLGRARYARLLLSTADLRRIGQASRTVAALAKADHDLIAEHERMMADLAKVRATLEERQHRLASARTAAQAAQLAAARATQAQANLIQELDRRRDLNAQLAGELEAAQLKLQAALRDAGTGASAADISLPFAPFRGDLDWPVAGEVKRRFGRAARGESPNGIELSAPEGSQVRAIHEGTVAFSGTFAGFGNLVIIQHGQTGTGPAGQRSQPGGLAERTGPSLQGSQAFSLYGDLLEATVTKGAKVDRGQTVGSVGPLPGGGTGLYFELRVDGRPVDPLQWLKKR